MNKGVQPIAPSVCCAPASSQRLTRRAIRKLSPGQWVSEHGIIFERFANGDGVFTVNIMVDRQRIHRVIGRESDGTTRTQAEEFIEKTRRDAREGRLNLPKGRKVALGSREAAIAYLERLKEEGGNDLIMKEHRLRVHLILFFSDTSISKLSDFSIERYKKHRIDEGAKERYALRDKFFWHDDTGVIQRRFAMLRDNATFGLCSAL